MRGLLVGMSVSQFILALWGRAFDDDFDQFHDFDHLPGKVQVVLRAGVGVVFFRQASQLLASDEPAVRAVMRPIRALGAVYFAALPVGVLLALCVARSRRHAVVTAFALLCQCAALGVLLHCFLNPASLFYQTSTLTHGRSDLGFKDDGELDAEDPIRTDRSGKPETWGAAFKKARRRIVTD